MEENTQVVENQEVEVVETETEGSNKPSTIPYARFKEVNDKLKQARAELDALKLQNASNEEKLKETISQEDYNKFKADQESEFNKKYSQLKITNSLETELIKANVKQEYLEMIKTQIDITNLKLTDDKVSDSNGTTLDQIINNKKASYPDLFGKTTKEVGTVTTPVEGNTPGVSTNDDARLRALFGLK